MIGETLSHYHIVRRVGKGGMGVVYKARDTRLGRFVALKFVAEPRRLREEAQMASALNHPGICTIYDIDEDGGRPFIVMEFMEGQTLKQKLAEQRLSVQKAIGYTLQIADALGKAHAKGIVHRDINPSNLFVTDDDRVKLLDFGIAKVVTSEVSRPALTGTVCYMSPEQARLQQVDGRSDIFSLGVVLYEMLTGRRPFRGRSIRETIQRIVCVEPEPMGVPEIEDVVSRCLKKDPKERYQSTRELIAALRGLKPATTEVTGHVGAGFSPRSQTTQFDITSVWSSEQMN
jgi:Kae1-associated kinase Bud32